MTIHERAVAAEDARRDQQPPSLSEGVELIGEYEHSGFKEPPSLVRRPDGQILQFPPLLYELLLAMDGRRHVNDIASQVSDRVHRQLAPDDVTFLVEEKLRPQGVVTAADGTSPQLSRPDPFLAFRYRLGVISERTSGRLGAAFKPLFLPPVLLVILVALVAGDWWLFVDHGVAQALRQIIYHPGLFLPLLAAIVVCAALHETGHAAACRYGGAQPGRMGCGLYLAWPAFYTDVSDAYRLNRRGRLRTDLGGVYLNAVIIVALTALFLFTRNLEVLVLLVVIEHMEIAHQLLPVIRLDGYYVVSDLTGVPDLFARIGPILRGLQFWRDPDPRVTVLKRWVRAAVTAWVLVVVPILLLELLMVLIHLPRILATAWDSAEKLTRASGHSFHRGRVLDGSSDVIQIAVLAIPITGLMLMIAQLFRKLTTWGWRTTRRRPFRRTLAIVVMAGAVTILALTWIPARNYQPIGPGERGTEGEGLHALFSVIGGPGPLYSQQAALQRAQQQQRDRTNQQPQIQPAPAGPGGQQTPTRVPGVTAPPSPVTLPPVTVPPVTLPHVTVPPVTLPHVTVPPVTLPHVTVPPVTLPHVTVPPVTVPPVTVPPATVPPVTVPSTLSPLIRP